MIKIVRRAIFFPFLFSSLCAAANPGVVPLNSLKLNSWADLLSDGYVRLTRNSSQASSAFVPRPFSLGPNNGFAAFFIYQSQHGLGRLRLGILHRNGFTGDSGDVRLLPKSNYRNTCERRCHCHAEWRRFAVDDTHSTSALRAGRVPLRLGDVPKYEQDHEGLLQRNGDAARYCLA